jgi:hypothetical protein
MENAETILVLILASFLAIFLVLAIILIAKCIQIANRIDRITQKAETIVDSAESIGDYFRAASSSLTIGKIISFIASGVFSRQRKGRK